MPYPEGLVTPMRQELVRIGVDELRTANEVEAVFGNEPRGTTLLVINSVCGCAAANARPAVTLAQQGASQPDRSVTVFAGQDLDATSRAREYLPGIPSSSPFIALFKDGTPVFVLERRNIEGRSASAIASDLVNAYDTFCGPASTNGHASGNGDSQDQASTEPDTGTFRSIL